MARLDTIRALEKRGLSTQLAEKTVELGYQLGTLKKCTLKKLEKDFYYKEILQLIQLYNSNMVKILLILLRVSSVEQLTLIA